MMLIVGGFDSLVSTHSVPSANHRVCWVALPHPLLHKLPFRLLAQNCLTLMHTLVLCVNAGTQEGAG